MTTVRRYENPRKKRQARIRGKVAGDAARPRLSVFRSNTSIYAQLIDDVRRHTLCSANELELKGKSGNKTERAALVGQLLAEKALKGGIKQAVFDRGGYRYHGRVKALAEGARQGGLKF